MPPGSVKTGRRQSRLPAYEVVASANAAAELQRGTPVVTPSRWVPLRTPRPRARTSLPGRSG